MADVSRWKFTDLSSSAPSGECPGLRSCCAAGPPEHCGASRLPGQRSAPPPAPPPPCVPPRRRNVEAYQLFDNSVCELPMEIWGE